MKTKLTLTSKTAIFIMYVIAILMTFTALNYVLSPDSFMKSESLFSDLMNNPTVFITVFASYIALVGYLQYNYYVNKIKII